MIDDDDDDDDRRPRHDLAEALRPTNHALLMAIDPLAGASGRFADRRWAAVAEMAGRPTDLVNGWERRQVEKAEARNDG